MSENEVTNSNRRVMYTEPVLETAHDKIVQILGDTGFTLNGQALFEVGFNALLDSVLTYGIGKETFCRMLLAELEVLVKPLEEQN